MQLFSEERPIKVPPLSGGTGKHRNIDALSGMLSRWFESISVFWVYNSYEIKTEKQGREFQTFFTGAIIFQQKWYCNLNYSRILAHTKKACWTDDISDRTSEINNSRLRRVVSVPPKGQTTPKRRTGGDFQQIVKVPKGFRPVRPGCFPVLFGIHPDMDNGCIAGTKAVGPCERHGLRSLSVSVGSYPLAFYAWALEAPIAGTS